MISSQNRAVDLCLTAIVPTREFTVSIFRCAALTIVTALCAAGCDDAKAPGAPVGSGQKAPGATAEVVVVTDATFKSVVLEAKEPVVVDLWAAWCGPCMRAAPSIKTLASDYAGRAKVCKIDFDTNPIAAKQYGAQGIPVFIVFKGGKEVHRAVGFSNDGHLRKELSAALDGAMK
ncbi:MAG: redoxin family protein [Phycisphaerales bacterium]|nr:redoxin family protein [Phycisphaerales bacterium]